MTKVFLLCPSTKHPPPPNSDTLGTKACGIDETFGERASLKTIADGRCICKIQYVMKTVLSTTEVMGIWSLECCILKLRDV